MTAGILILLSHFFLNYYATFRETQTRLRLQRDMRTLSYWIRKDLTALIQRNNNFDLKNGSNDFSFVAADDPEDTQDQDINTTDNDMDRFTYTFAGNLVTRTWNPLGTMPSVRNVFTLESIEPEKGDTYAVEITLYDVFDSPVIRTQFDGILENFDYDAPIKKLELRIIFSKRPAGSLFKARPSIVERSEMRAVAFYRKG